MRVIERILISTSDKTGLVEFVRGLLKFGVEVISTGGTARLLSNQGVPVIHVSDLTGFPEMLDGRVKTLHPAVHAGILAKRGSIDHQREIEAQSIRPIDMVVVNLYPFEKATQDKNLTFEEAIEYIDIGGTALIRSAAKNFESVVILTQPNDYPLLLKEMERNNGAVSPSIRFRLALKAFEYTSRYDSVISDYLFKSKKAQTEFTIPYFRNNLNFQFEKIQDLRYGENPHQKGAFYRNLYSDSQSDFSKLQKLHGKELSFNNLLDLASGWEAATEFEEPTAVIIKHNNPCGIASAPELAEAYKWALECDPISAYGCVIALNREVDLETAKLIHETLFVECIAAPAYAANALELLSQKKTRRIVQIPLPSLDSENHTKKNLIAKFVGDALLIQEKDQLKASEISLKFVTKKPPTGNQLQELLFAFQACKFVRSNAIVLAQGSKTVGIGAGQMSRVDSVRLAINKAADRAQGAVMASDGFFPMRDNIDEAAKAGIKAIIQPGGSKKDPEVIEACNEHGIAMVFTGIRHFRH